MDEGAEGQLILAWANLGALVEGTMKLFLTVHYDDYLNDKNTPHNNRGSLVAPEKLVLEALRVFFQKAVWPEEEAAEIREWVAMVQAKRNSIHAFAERDIGTHDDFVRALQRYLKFLDNVDQSLPYPDDWPRIDWDQAS